MWIRLFYGSLMTHHNLLGETLHKAWFFSGCEEAAASHSYHTVIETSCCKVPSSVRVSLKYTRGGLQLCKYTSLYSFLFLLPLP